jgi:vesicle coat complex subunit
MGILKLYHLDKEAFEQCNFTDILYDMLRDADASVVSNCIIVLNEIMAKTKNAGGMAINRAIMLHLLNRIHEFTEFGVIEVLELIPRYIPANEEEGFQIMNLLDPVLRTSNAGAVLATIRAFLSLAGGDQTMQRQVVTRIKAPFVTLISSGSSELVHCLLQNADALVELCPGIFDDEYRQFYIKYNVSVIMILLL